MKVLLILFVICCGVLTKVEPLHARDACYDVSYLWHADLQKVLAYRQSVGRILGPKLAAKLHVVRNKRHYGLIYDRNGDAASTLKIAKIHTRILRSQGLDGAVPIKDWNWSVVYRGSPSPKAEGSPAKRGSWTAAKKKTSAGAAKINLEERIEVYIKKLRRQGRIAANVRTAWSVYDLSSGEKLVTINEDVPLQAASMVKPFFALAFFHQVNEGRLSYGSKSRRMIRAMIQKSSNDATNWVIRQLGGPRMVQRLLKRHYGGIFRQTSIIEYIPSGGQTYRNKASAHDYSRFLYAIWHKNVPRAHEIKRLMSLPNRDRLFTGARAVPHGTRVYHKSGSTNYSCGEMGILEVKSADGKRHAYTVIAIIESKDRTENFTQWIRSQGNVIREVSNIVYSEIRRRHHIGF